MTGDPPYFRIFQVQEGFLLLCMFFESFSDLLHQLGSVRSFLMAVPNMIFAASHKGLGPV